MDFGAERIRKHAGCLQINLAKPAFPKSRTRENCHHPHTYINPSVTLRTASAIHATIRHHSKDLPKTTKDNNVACYLHTANSATAALQQLAR